MRRVLKRTPEEMARREKIDEMLKAANVTSMYRKLSLLQDPFELTTSSFEDGINEADYEQGI